MTVRPGGKQPIMRETVFDGKVQQMVLPDGRPKGLKMVLQERGVDTKGINAEKMRQTLSKYPDFANSKTIVQEKIEAATRDSEAHPVTRDCTTHLVTRNCTTQP